MPTGSQKLLEVWTNRQIIDHAMLLKLQAKVDSIIVPPNIGRIPCKISSSFARFKAEEWKNWSIAYSVYCLKDIFVWHRPTIIVPEVFYF